MKVAHSIARVLFAMLLVLHGFAHSPAILGAWKLKTFEDVSYRPNILLEHASDAFVYLLGLVWLIAAVAFIVAGLGVLRRTVWWPHLAGFAIAVSLAMTTLWKDDAIAGLVIDLGLLALMATIAIRAMWQSRDGHDSGMALPTPA